MKKNLIHSVKIQAVHNGYTVLIGDNAAGGIYWPEIRVFNTLDQLQRWLRENLEKPKEKCPSER